MAINNIQPIYRRVLLKISGEVLQGSENFGIDPIVLNRLAKEIKELVQLNIQVGIVIGGGNLFRGAKLAKAGMHRINSDYIGMLATIINGLAMCDALRCLNIKTCLMSAISIRVICDSYNLSKAIQRLIDDKIIIFVAGTGNPFFTTDSAACLRGIEVNAQVLLKGTKVDGIFSADPEKYKDAVFYTQLSYNDVLKKELKVMDLAAFTLARDHNLPIRIFNINKPGILQRIVMGKQEGTLITN